MFAVVKIRGNVGVNRDLKKTMALLGLNRVNHLVLVDETPSNKKMVEKVKDFVSFGEIDEKTLIGLLKKRGRLAGNKRISEEFLKQKNTSLEEISKELLNGKKRASDFGIKKVFRLSPPKKGFERKGIKKAFNIGGALGYRANDITKLINKMV